MGNKRKTEENERKRKEHGVNARKRRDHAWKMKRTKGTVNSCTVNVCKCSVPLCLMLIISSFLFMFLISCDDALDFSWVFMLLIFWELNLERPVALLKSAFLSRDFHKVAWKPSEIECPSFRYAEPLLKPWLTPRRVQLPFLGTCARKVEGRKRIMTCKMRKQGRKMTGQRKGKRKDKDGIFF